MVKFLMIAMMAIGCYYTQNGGLLIVLAIANIVAQITTAPIMQYDKMTKALGISEYDKIMEMPEELQEYIKKWYIRFLPLSLGALNFISIIYITIVSIRM